MASSGLRVARRPADGGARWPRSASSRRRAREYAYDLKQLAVNDFDEYGEVVVPDCVRGALRPLVSQIDALDEVELLVAR
jgi:hypothetical protein